MLNEQKIRGVLFYLSVLIFFAGLPSILCVALGYKFDSRTFKFTKTGLIALRTQPSGAEVYLDNRLLTEKTPLTIDDLLPGTYQLKLALENYYPWQNQVRVEPRRVTRLEKIILFPVRPNIRQVNKEALNSFWVDEERGVIYYANPQDAGIYKSDLDGDNYEKIAIFAPLEAGVPEFILSPDREKVAYFNRHQVGTAYLKTYVRNSLADTSFILNYKQGAIKNIFWHSDSYHLVLVSEKSVDVLEASPEAVALTLVKMNKKDSQSSYDMRTDTLYFTDTEKAADGNNYDNLYKLELNTRIFPFQQLIKIKTGGEQK